MPTILRKRSLNLTQYLFFLGFGIFLLWLCFRKLDMDEVWIDILSAHYSWLLLSLLVALTSHIFRALRWNLLINSMGYKTRLSTTFFSVMVGYMANTAVPRMGEFMRCGMLSKKEKIPFNALFGTVISERLFDLIVLVFIIVSLVIFQFDLLEGLLSKMFGGIKDNLFSDMTLLFIFVLVSSVFIGLVIFLLRRYKPTIQKLIFYKKTRTFIIGLIEGIKTIIHLKEKLLFLIYTFVIWLAYALMVYLPVFMFPETSHLDFIDAMTLMSIGSLGIVAPVPGGIGAYHFIIKSILFELYHINSSIAGSFAAITHAGQTLLNVLVGAFSYFSLTILAKTQKPLNEQN
ncbi:MAG: flippase-like domain-containing protein [Bacteroidetes bacterium]|nr:flippase-like domain-containing protein [Bacteroidota bacterium]